MPKNSQHSILANLSVTSQFTLQGSFLLNGIYRQIQASVMRLRLTLFTIHINRMYDSQTHLCQQ